MLILSGVYASTRANAQAGQMPRIAAAYSARPNVRVKKSSVNWLLARAPLSGPDRYFGQSNVGVWLLIAPARCSQTQMVATISPVGGVEIAKLDYLLAPFTTIFGDSLRPPDGKQRGEC